MSNFLAVATVTAALQRLLRELVAADVPGATVTTERPDTKKAQTQPAVNLYLYQVSPDPAWRNLDLPTRRPDGSVVQRPQAALDLHYLISFYGNDGELEPQRLLGSTVRTLNGRPVITRELIQAVVADAGAATQPVHPSLAGTDLADAVDLVRICPLPLDLEELSKLWSVFFQTPYALSTAWSAAVVLLEERDEPVPSLPVAAPVLAVAPLRHPVVDRVAVAADPALPVTADATIRVTGTQLRGDTTAVRLGGVELAPSSTTDSAVEVDLSGAPATAFRAGTATVEVVQRWLVGTPPSPRGEVVSLPVAVPLHPRVVATTVSAGTVSVQTDVTVGLGQRVALQLVDPTTGTIVKVLTVGDRTADSTSVAVSSSGLPGGTYALVLLVDGAGSPVERDQAGTITAPTVALP
jgi:hypothetical protein